MDVYLHTALAVGVIAVAYYCGRWSVNDKLESIIAAMLDTLEKEGCYGGGRRFDIGCIGLFLFRSVVVADSNLSPQK